MTKKTTSKKQKKLEAKATNLEAKAPDQAPRPKLASGKKEKEFRVEWQAIEGLENTVDEQQVNKLTDHVFSSVLSKFGWTRDEQGHLEKTGIEEAA